MTIDAERVTLREITAETVIPVIKLSVAENQKRFVAPNAVSLAQALFAPEAWYRAIYADDEPVGFVMLADETLRDPPPETPKVGLWRFMVDARHQGRGIGRVAMAHVIEHVRAKGVVDTLELSFVPGEGGPEAFYRSLGFRDTGRVDEGEVVLELPLRDGVPGRALPSPTLSASIVAPRLQEPAMPQISGSCLCGAIRYTSPVSPVMVALCHCTHCQKQSGGAFSVNVAVPKGSLQFTSGKTAVYEDRGTSGMPVYRHFCGSCGSPIFSDVVATPQLDWLKAGTLDDTSWVKPSANIWCQSAQGWVAYPEGVPKFPQNPPTA